jgi:hypothetical protein
MSPFFITRMMPSSSLIPPDMNPTNSIVPSSLDRKGGGRFHLLLSKRRHRLFLSNDPYTAQNKHAVRCSVLTCIVISCLTFMTINHGKVLHA